MTDVERSEFVHMLDGISSGTEVDSYWIKRKEG